MFRTTPRIKDQGFTLIELMIIIAIIGILAAAAIPLFMDYMSKGKKTEADVQINSALKAMKAYFAETGKFPTTAQPQIPSTSACGAPAVKGVFPAGTWPVYTVMPDDPAATPFEALEFRIDDAFRFNYGYESGAPYVGAPPVGASPAASIYASGDLDCDAGTLGFAPVNAISVIGTVYAPAKVPATKLTRLGSD